MTFLLRCSANRGGGGGVADVLPAQQEVRGHRSGGAREDNLNNQPAVWRVTVRTSATLRTCREVRGEESFSGHLQAEQTLRSPKHSWTNESEKKRRRVRSCDQFSPLGKESTRVPHWFPKSTTHQREERGCKVNVLEVKDRSSAHRDQTRLLWSPWFSDPTSRNPPH